MNQLDEIRKLTFALNYDAVLNSIKYASKEQWIKIFEDINDVNIVSNIHTFSKNFIESKKGIK